MKKIINNPQEVVNDMLVGMQIACPEVFCDTELNTVFRRDKAENKVAVITGGGSGHEPAHSGYVGKGLLDAAVAGNVFASPPADKIYSAMTKIETGRGLIQIIKNYSGDIMNFGLAKDLAELDGMRVEQIIVKDDVATEDRDDTAGRRGIAGTVFVHKIVGALAESGADIEHIVEVGNRAISGMRTIGLALSSCTLPAVGHVGFELGEQEIELGMGIHGEPGIERTSIKTAAELAEIMVQRIMKDYSYSGKDVAVLVNGLGATPLMEQYILTAEIEKNLSMNNVNVKRWFVGNYLTSFEMAGASVTLLELDDEILAALDAPCNSPAWKCS